MKTIITVHILLISLSVFSQSVDWSDPVRLTDTVSFNSNPVIAVTPQNFEDNLLMFYEKQFTPESPKQIWMRKISEPMGEETQMLADNTIVYRNPMVFGFSWLIFESNPNGNFDLFALEFDESGNPGDTIQLTNTPINESSFFIADRFAYTACWESGDRIIIAEIFGEEPEIFNTDTLDSGDCHDPVCTFFYAAWSRVENNESHLYYSELNLSWQWSEPEILMATGNNTNLKIADDNGGEPRHICWENSDTVLYCDIVYEPEIISPHFPGISFYHQPAAFNLWVIIDYLPELFSFAGVTENQTDIFLCDGMYGTEPLNLSIDQETNSNPVLYGGRNDTYQTEVIAIWQTQFNGFEALYKSDAWYQTYYSIGDNEVNNSGLSLKISPCPFYGKLTFDMYFPESGPASLEIFDISGNLIKWFEFIAVKTGSQIKSWNPQNESIFLSPGVFFVRLNQGNKAVVQKAIFSK